MEGSLRAVSRCRESGGLFSRDLSRPRHSGARQRSVLLDTTKTEGGGDWSGQFVGTSFIFSHAAVLNTLEGDPRSSSMTAARHRLRARAQKSGAAAETTGAERI